MANDYSDRLILIRYHAWWPVSDDPYYQYNISQNTSRINYYGADYTPHFWVDGTVDGGSGSGNWENQILSEMNDESSVDIVIRGNYNSSTRQINLIVTVFGTGHISYSNLKLRIAVTESNLAYQAPNGSYWHHQTFRNMYPGTNGAAFSLNQGEVFEYEYSFTLNSTIVETNCDIVAFVQSDSGHRILQGGKVSLRALAPANTLLPFGLLSPPNGGVINTCYPEFLWESTVEPGSSDPISYTVFMAQNPEFTSPLISDPVPETTWTSNICLIPDIPYYWKVVASNGSAPDRNSSGIFSFTVELPQDIPTLSEWGMIIFLLLLMAIGTGGIISINSKARAGKLRNRA